MRVLDPLSDDLNPYLSWMRDRTSSPHIQSTRPDFDLEELIAYLHEILESECADQFGIFTRSDGRHIGNIKFHDISRESRTAVVGFLIGEVELRGLGIAKEAFDCTFDWISRHYAVSRCILGVNKTNLPGIRAYEKMGFVATHPQGQASDSPSIIMEYRQNPTSTLSAQENSGMD